MPELPSVPGRCPRCSQLLALPARQLHSLFRCARCQYRVPATTLVEEAQAHPPKLGSSVLRPFDENSEDQHTRLHLPDQEEAEVALAALAVEGPPSMPPPPAPMLQRFDAVVDDADDQQTRVHAGGFEVPAPRPPARLPPPGRVPSRRPSGHDATILGMPSAPQLHHPLERASEESDDQATRVHMTETFASPPGMLDGLKDQTLVGVAPAPVIPGRPVPAAPLQRFDQVPEDAEGQTRLQVPISFEDEDEEEEEVEPEPESDPVQAVAAFPELRPKVAPPRPVVALEDDEYPPRGLERFGRATLAVSRWIDDWLHEQRDALIVLLASLCGLIAPTVDILAGSTRQVATVIAANLALFFLWTLLLGWFGTARDDRGAWDYRVAWTRITTGLRLAWEDLTQFGRLPQPLKWRLCSELAGAFGLIGLAFASAFTLSRLVWGTPSSDAFISTLRSLSALSIAFSVIARRTSGNVPISYDANPEVTAPAVAHFPAVVDLSLPLSANPAHSSTMLHQVLDILSQWHPREWPNRDSYVAALERHFLRQMGWARVEKERWLGRERREGVAQLLINEGLLIEVLRGFDPNAADRVSSKMRALAKVWRGKPAIIVIFDASRAALLDSEGTPPLEALHESYPMLAVRMPSARMSVA